MATHASRGMLHRIQQAIRMYSSFLNGKPYEAIVRNGGPCLDFFVLLQPAPYLACPPLCPYDCLSGNVVFFLATSNDTILLPLISFQIYRRYVFLISLVISSIFLILLVLVFSSSGLWTIESASHWDSLGSFGPGPVSA